MLTFTKQLTDLSFSFLVCIAFTVLIFAIDFTKIRKKKLFLFAITLSFILWGCKIAFHTFLFWSTKLLDSLLFFSVCKLILKTNDIESLIYTIVCSSVIYITDILNMFIRFDNMFFGYALQFTIVAAVFFKLLYKTPAITFLSSIKNYLLNDDAIYFFLIVAILSFNISAFTNVCALNIILCIQALIIGSIIHFLENKIKIRKLKSSIKVLNIENDTLKGLLDNIRIFKHDYSNTLCSIGGYISLNDMTGLKNFYSKLSVDLSNVNNIQKINITSINEPSIYNLFTIKNKAIIKNHLKLDFYSDINYKNLAISPYDLSKILGIFIDNAIDAATISPEKEISIICKNVKNKFSQITIKNTYQNKDVSIKDMFSKGYSSKDVKSGLGLWEVSKIINSTSNASLETDKDENYFMQRLTLNYKELNNI